MELIPLMEAACDRLLCLVTGRAVTDPANLEAALEAIELLMLIENGLKVSASTPLPILEEEALAQLKHRHKVLDLLSDVLAALEAQGLLPAAPTA